MAPAQEDGRPRRHLDDRARVDAASAVTNISPFSLRAALSSDRRTLIVRVTGSTKSEMASILAEKSPSG